MLVCPMFSRVNGHLSIPYICKVLPHFTPFFATFGSQMVVKMMSKIPPPNHCPMMGKKKGIMKA